MVEQFKCSPTEPCDTTWTAAIPGEEGAGAEPGVPDHRGEDLGGVLVDHGEAGGDHELAQLGEGGLAGLTGESQGEEETDPTQPHEGGHGPPPASVVHSHWSRNVEARLSLVESLIVLLLQLSYLVLYGIRDRWLPCTERSYYRRPDAIKNQALDARAGSL